PRRDPTAVRPWALHRVPLATSPPALHPAPPGRPRRIPTRPEGSLRPTLLRDRPRPLQRGPRHPTLPSIDDPHARRRAGTPPRARGPGGPGGHAAPGGGGDRHGEAPPGALDPRPVAAAQ